MQTIKRFLMLNKNFLHYIYRGTYEVSYAYNKKITKISVFFIILGGKMGDLTTLTYGVVNQLHTRFFRLYKWAFF